MILGLHGYYPLHYGVMEFLDLGLETLAYLGDFVTLFDILSGVLEVYLKTLGCLISLCVGYSDYMLSLEIHLYTAVTLPIFCEDLMHLKRSSIFACLISIQRMEILSWLIMSSFWLLVG